MLFKKKEIKKKAVAKKEEVPVIEEPVKIPEIKEEKEEEITMSKLAEEVVSMINNEEDFTEFSTVVNGLMSERFRLAQLKADLRRLQG